MASPADSFIRPREVLQDTTTLVGNLDEDGIAEIETPGNGELTAASNGKRRVTQRVSRSGSAATSTTTSEDDYDDIKIDPSTVVQGSKGGGLKTAATLDAPRSRLGLDSLRAIDTSWATGTASKPSDHSALSSHHARRKSIPITLEKTGTKGQYLLSADDPEIREILRRGLQRESEGQEKKQRSRFSELVFTRQFTAFDRNNPASAASPFHGFFTLFWLSIALMLMKLAASNWKAYGSIFGPNEILTMMFHRDVLVLGITDGLMCAGTAFCLVLQKAILANYLSWDRSGWIIQNVGNQSFYLTVCTYAIQGDFTSKYLQFRAAKLLNTAFSAVYLPIKELSRVKLLLPAEFLSTILCVADSSR